MQKLAVYALLLALAGCNTYLPEAPRLEASTIKTPRATIAPSPARLSNPMVATDRSVLAYDEDLGRCRAEASAKMGSEAADDLTALKRTLQKGPLGGTVSVGYEPSDAAILRDKSVKDCLSRRGYVVLR